MKRFFLMILVVSVFFTGLGSMIGETAAKLKSDEKALAILQKARQAIGGDSSLAAVNSLVVTGKSTRTLRFGGQVPEKTIQGDMELALQFPDKMMKSVKMVHNDGSGTGEKTIDHQMDIVIVKDGEGNTKWKTMDGDAPKPGEGKKIIIKKDDGTIEEIQPGKDVTFTAERVAGGPQTEMSTGNGRQMVFHRTAQGAEGAPGEFPWQLARTTISLLLTAPQGMDVSYLYGGEENVDGTACHVINAQIGAASIRLFIGRDSNLPVMMSYQDAKPMVFAFRTHDNAGAVEAAAAGGDKQVKVFTRQAAAPEMAEFQVKFSDYRNVNGVQLPYKWTQTMGGQPDEVIDVTGYEINPAGIAEKFKSNGETKVFIRKAKEQ